MAFHPCTQPMMRPKVRAHGSGLAGGGEHYFARTVYPEQGWSLTSQRRQHRPCSPVELLF